MPVSAMDSTSKWRAAPDCGLWCNGAMDVSDVYLELFGRIPPLVHAAVDGLDAEALTRRPSQASNSVAWLVWHLTRVQDHHMTEILGGDQVWISGSWSGRFGLPADPNDTGFGHGPDDVAAVRPESAQVLVGYHEAVAARTRAFLQELTPQELDRIVDRRWTPPVTLGVRLVSIADDSLQHVGQAAYARGLVAPGWRLGY
jgi:uncharacterized damage-inducible protein DinB